MSESNIPWSFIRVPDHAPNRLVCASCGYLLRGLNTHGCCPECGHDIILSFYAAHAADSQRNGMAWLRSTGTNGLLMTSALWLLAAAPVGCLFIVAMATSGVGIEALGAAVICSGLMAYATMISASVLIWTTPYDNAPGGVLERLLAMMLALGWLIAVPIAIASGSLFAITLLYGGVPVAWLLIAWQWIAIARRLRDDQRRALWLLTVPSAMAAIVLAWRLFRFNDSVDTFTFAWVYPVTGLHALAAFAAAVVLKWTLRPSPGKWEAMAANRAAR